MWVPQLAIHAVEDADQLRRAIAEQLVKATSMFRSQNLARIIGTDGCNDICSVDTRFEERQAAVKFEALGGVGRQVQSRKSVSVKQALIG